MNKVNLCKTRLNVPTTSNQSEVTQLEGNEFVLGRSHLIKHPLYEYVGKATLQ